MGSIPIRGGLTSASFLPRGMAQLARQRCDFASVDHEACTQLLERLEDAARRRTLLTYKSFVKGISFKLPPKLGEVGASRLVIDCELLRARDEAIIHDFGRYLGAATYRDNGVLINSILVNIRAADPPKAFIDWVTRNGLCHVTHRDQQREYWLREIDRVYQVYGLGH